MRASDPAGYEGVEEITSGGSATGRALLLTNSTTTPIAITVSVTTNEVDTISRDYNNGTTSITKKVVSVVLLAGAGTTIIPVVGDYSITTVPANTKVYALR